MQPGYAIPGWSYQRRLHLPNRLRFPLVHLREAFAPSRSLCNPVFARLYAAQTTSLLGDALTWVGLALLAYELGGKNSAHILAFALTLRMTAFSIRAPGWGAG